MPYRLTADPHGVLAGVAGDGRYGEQFGGVRPRCWAMRCVQSRPAGSSCPTHSRSSRQATRVGGDEKRCPAGQVGRRGRCAPLMSDVVGICLNLGSPFAPR